VCGDTHGQYYDTLNIFKLNGMPSPENPYLFNGACGTHHPACPAGVGTAPIPPRSFPRAPLLPCRPTPAWLCAAPPPFFSPRPLVWLPPPRCCEVCRCSVDSLPKACLAVCTRFCTCVCVSYPDAYPSCRRLCGPRFVLRGECSGAAGIQAVVPWLRVPITWQPRDEEHEQGVSLCCSCCARWPLPARCVAMAAAITELVPLPVPSLRACAGCGTAVW
jgi:hypothetical protein